MVGSYLLHYYHNAPWIRFLHITAQDTATEPQLETTAPTLTLIRLELIEIDSTELDLLPTEYMLTI